MNCIYCGKYVFDGYIDRDGKVYKNIMVKQSGKYGKTIVAHRVCYTKSTRRATDERED